MGSRDPAVLVPPLRSVTSPPANFFRASGSPALFSQALQRLDIGITPAGLLNGMVFNQLAIPHDIRDSFALMDAAPPPLPKPQSLTPHWPMRAHLAARTTLILQR